MCQCVWKKLTVTKSTSVHTKLLCLIVDYSIFTLLGKKYVMQIKNHCNKIIYNTYTTKNSTILFKIPEINVIR